MIIDIRPEPSRWLPTTNLVELACVGKMTEEIGELSVELLTMNRNGITDEILLALQNEISDVLATKEMVASFYQIMDATNLPDTRDYPESREEAIIELSVDLGLMTKILGRIVIQGHEGTDPSSGELNKERLREQMKQLHFSIANVCIHYDLNRDEIETRKKRKVAFESQWHQMLREIKSR